MDKKLAAAVGVTLLFLFVVLIADEPTPSYIFIGVPSNYQGQINITEDRGDYSLPDIREPKNLDRKKYRIDYQYEANEAGLLKVRNIDTFEDWDRVSFGFTHIEPIIRKARCSEAWEGAYAVSDPQFQKNKITVEISKCTDLLNRNP
jgi:hypothetical protein